MNAPASNHCGNSSDWYTQREFQVGYKGRKSGKRNLKGILRHPNRRNNQFIFWLSLTFGWQQIVVDIWRCGTREQKAPLSCYHRNHQILHVAIKLWKNLPNEKEDGGDLKIENKEGFIGKCPNTQCHLSLSRLLFTLADIVCTCSVSMEQLNSTVKELCSL